MTGLRNYGDEALNPVPTLLDPTIDADEVTFLPSGTGAVERTMQDIGRSIVRSGDYDTTPHFNTARDALTETIGLKAFQVGTSVLGSSIAFPARTAGRGQSAIINYDATFSGTVDPNLSLGYNLAADGSAAQAGEPQGLLSFEGNYNDGSGQNKLELYFQWNGLPAQVGTYRPFFSQANRSTGYYKTLVAGDIIQFGNNDLSASAMDVYPTQILLLPSYANYWTVLGATAGNTPSLTASGSDTDISLAYNTKGVGSHIFKTGGGARVSFVANNAANAINYFDIYPAAIGSAPLLLASGTDTNVGIVFSSKGTGGLRFFTNATGQEHLRINHTANAINYLQITGGIAGANASISVSAENLLFGSGSALLTTAIAGYVMFPSCAGTPTGVPTGQAAGKIPMIFDTTGIKLWFYTGGSWKGVVVA